MKTTKLLVILFLLPLTQAFSQSIQFPCHTHSLSNDEMAQSAEYQQNRQELEKFTQEWLNENAGQKSVTAPKVIPVVFHIIHEGGPENIPDANIHDQMRILNEDFQKLNSDTTAAAPAFAGIIGDMNLEFRLATKDPQGNCTNGITRIFDPGFTNAGSGTRPVIWPRSQYLNVWIVKDISFGAGAYTYLPGVSANIDGIVCRYTQFSSLFPSVDDRTMTHEIGHWFNLYHPWGTTNNPGLQSNCNDDDGVMDTPNTIGAGGCNLNQQSCGSLDNVQNYMDYAFCGMMFTQGQVDRMTAAVNSGIGQRNNLWTQSNLIATGTDSASLANPPTCIPIAEFEVSTRSVCAGNTIQFFDKAYNATYDTTWQFNWTFPGGTPATSTDRNPIVSYAQAGFYDATLQITNTAGTSSPETKSNYITITEGSGAYIAPYLESATRTEFPGNNTDNTLEWEISRPTGSLQQFQRFTGAFYSAPASIYLNNFAFNASGKHRIESPIANLSNLVADSAFLNFQIAYRQKANEVEFLELFVSQNCGFTWSREKIWFGFQLVSNTSPLGLPFTPTDSTDWKFISLGLDKYAGKANVQFRFVWNSNSGNNVYFDDISLSETPNPEPLTVGIEEEIDALVNIFPNPNNGEFTISYPSIGTQLEEIEVYNLLGQRILTISELENAENDETYSVNLNKYGIDRGIYFISFGDAKNKVQRKIIVD